MNDGVDGGRKHGIDTQPARLRICFIKEIVEGSVSIEL